MRHYDAHGLPAGKTSYNSSGEATHYDANGLPAGKTSYYENGEAVHYDANGLPAGRTVKYSDWEEYHYDANGLPAGRTTIDEFGNKTHYDAHGFKIGETRNDSINWDALNLNTSAKKEPSKEEIMLYAGIILGIYKIFKVLTGIKFILFYVSVFLSYELAALFFDLRKIEGIEENISKNYKYTFLLFMVIVTIICYTILFVLRYKFKIKRIILLCICLIALLFIPVMYKECAQRVQVASSWDMSSSYYKWLYESWMAENKMMKLILTPFCVTIAFISGIFCLKGNIKR